jgi:hypothetical protein
MRRFWLKNPSGYPANDRHLPSGECLLCATRRPIEATLDIFTAPSTEFSFNRRFQRRLINQGR